MNNHEPSIRYLCDRKKCEECLSDLCSYTTDINHAKNFIKRWGDFVEVETKDQYKEKQRCT
jgi:hypothetical protein